MDLLETEVKQCESARIPSERVCDYCGQPISGKGIEVGITEFVPYEIRSYKPFCYCSPFHYCSASHAAVHLWGFLKWFPERRIWGAEETADEIRKIWELMAADDPR